MDPNIPSQPSQPEPAVLQQSKTPGNTKTIITVLLLLFVSPIGLIFMWLWMKWPIWAKVALSIMVLFFLVIPLAITLIAINPARQFTQANNTQRTSDVNMILNSISQYRANNNDQLPVGITTTSQVISTTGADICGELVPSYIPALPVDPSIKNSKGISDCSVTYNTGYTIIRNAENDRITVSAPDAEGNMVIAVSR